MRAKILERKSGRGQYDMVCKAMIVEHPAHGRLLLVEGFGGMDKPQGGVYRWEHGLVFRLQPEDTLESLHTGAWNEGTTLYQAVVHGYDDSRPLLDWNGHAIRKLAEAAR